MKFVDGISLVDLLLEQDWSLKKGLPDSIIETVYSQITNIYLQLFRHCFPKIRSLSTVEGSGVGRH